MCSRVFSVNVKGPGRAPALKHYTTKNYRAYKPRSNEKRRNVDFVYQKLLKHKFIKTISRTMERIALTQPSFILRLSLASITSLLPISSRFKVTRQLRHQHKHRTRRRCRK